MIGTLEIDLKKVSKSRISEFDENNIQFAKVYSDHMFQSVYRNGEWNEMEIVPYANLSLSPANTTLHYGQSIFEGLKAYKDANGDVLVFRPQANAQRMIKSAERMCIPPVGEDMFMTAMTELLRLDSQWVPSKPGTSLYIRPVIFGLDPYIGIKPSDEYMFLIFTSPVGGYYSEPVKVKIETHYTRAAMGGVGAAKTAGNYAAALYPTLLAIQKGYNQLIWTDGLKHEFIEESGTMNIAFMFDDTLVTAPAGDTILHGITRDSVLTLAKDWGVKVEERPIPVAELLDLLKSGRVKEAFGMGTAATIAPIKAIGHEDTDYELPSVDKWELAPRVLKTLDEIKTGKVEDKFGWVYRV